MDDEGKLEDEDYEEIRRKSRKKKQNDKSCSLAGHCATSLKLKDLLTTDTQTQI